MFKITQNYVRYSRNGVNLKKLLRINFSSVPIIAKTRNFESEAETINGDNSQASFKRNHVKEGSGLVAAAFASLKVTEEPLNKTSTPFTDGRIIKAKTVEEILSISEGNGVSRKFALKVVSILADWSTSGKAQLSEFESDPRFIRLCKILTKGNFVKPKSTFLRQEDWSTILNITADDEAAKLISSISLPQMVKVMSTLSVKKRRSTPLLRSLAFNIARNIEKLDLKQSADLLYSAAVLNFSDTNLFEKICNDVCSSLHESVKGTAVIGSIITSLGLLRYKDSQVLDALSDWVLRNHEQCRSQDIFSVFITLAILNHQPVNAEELYKVLIPTLNISEATRTSVWLDLVWSLVVLNQAQNEHVSSVLDNDFITKLEGDFRNPVMKLKLLNIDSASEVLIKDYKGPRLSGSFNVKKAEIVRTKNKEILVSAVQDSLGNLLNPATHLRTNVDTKMGFYIDAELLIDKKCNPVALNKEAESSDEFLRIAVMAYDYHDMCHGRIEPTGISTLFARLLEAKGYHILPVPYTEFSPKDKLVNRVKYLETKLKNLATQS